MANSCFDCSCAQVRKWGRGKAVYCALQRALIDEVYPNWPDDRVLAMIENVPWMTDAHKCRGKFFSKRYDKPEG